MRDDIVEVKFDSPRSVREAGKSYWLSNGESELQLPVRLTELVKDIDEGVFAVRIPHWLAEKEGLTEATETQPVSESCDDGGMSRYDWFLLGSVVGLLIQGIGTRDVVWEAAKLADELMKCKEPESE